MVLVVGREDGVEEPVCLGGDVVDDELVESR
jgi:hypothetical protein